MRPMQRSRTSTAGWATSSQAHGSRHAASRHDQLVAVFDERRDPLHLSTVAIRQAELDQPLGRIDASFASLGHALELARSSNDAKAELRALRSLAFLYWQSNRDEEALAYNE